MPSVPQKKYIETITLRSGGVIHLTAEEVETLEYHVRTTDYKPPPPLRPHELAELFGEDRELKKYLNEKRKEILAEFESLLEEERGFRNKYYMAKDRDTLELHEWGINKRREKLSENKDHIERILSFMGGKNKKKVQDFQLELQKAKTYPIDQLIEVKGVKAQCLWHEDRNPSLHYYRKNNTVWCFACNKGGDAIDVVMQLRDCTLHDAIAFINNH